LRSRSFELPGIRLHALEDGRADSRLLILLHGFPEFSGAWRRLIPPLVRAGLHVVAPDQRGYAQSDKPQALDAYAIDVLGADVLRLADACGAARFCLAGHDWGGVVAWWVALHHPERLDRLAILNAPHPAAFERVVRRDPRQLARSWYVAAFQLPRLPEWLMSRRGMAAAVRALVDSSRPGTFSVEDLARYRQAWSYPGAWTGMINWYRAGVRRPSSVRVPPRVVVPTLILWGDRDRALLPRLAEESLRFCDHGHLVRFPDATHWLHHEEAAGVADALVGFFGSD